MALTEKELEYQKTYRERHGDEIKARRQLPENKLKHQERTKKWRMNNQDTIKNAGLMRGYGISLEEYRELLEKQRGVCSVCGKEEISRHKSGLVKQLAVDHDHETGKVRGLLCNNCNRAIGLFGDDKIILLKAVAYLWKKL